MSKLIQEFFWTPDELLAWVKRIRDELGLWLVLWRPGRNADLVDPDSLSPTQFHGPDDSIQLFLGDPSLCPQPKWRVVGDRRELDFRASYAVQLVPSIVAPSQEILLQGRLAIMRVADYDDGVRYAELEKLFRSLRADLKSNSDLKHVVVQSLSSGVRKRWPTMLVSPAVITSTAKLRQFSRGEVEFGIEPA
jgi:hypothetical protein